MIGVVNLSAGGCRKWIEGSHHTDVGEKDDATQQQKPVFSRADF